LVNDPDNIVGLVVFVLVAATARRWCHEPGSARSKPTRPDRTPKFSRDQPPEGTARRGVGCWNRPSLGGSQVGNIENAAG
jgi:hypothetical protein